MMEGTPTKVVAFGRVLWENLRLITQDRVSRYSLYFLIFVILLAIFGPPLTPYGISEIHYDESGTINRLATPSLEHPLGTTEQGYDVLSRLLFGARGTMLVGFGAGTIIITLGAALGISAGYLGGRTEATVMRFVDFMYSLPVIPVAIVVLGIIGVGFWPTLLLLGALLWRSSARVLRSEVLQIKEQEYIKSARALGASPVFIIRHHIVPNIMSMIILFYAVGIGVSILYQAGFAFIGVSNPFIPTWGVMIRNAFRAGRPDAWFWIVPPGLLISFTVLATFLLGRGYERIGESVQDH